MGGIVKGLFGGSGSKSSSTSSSSNQAFDYLKNTLGSNVSGGVTGTNSLMDFLGLNGADGTGRANTGLSNFMNSTGFQSMIDSATKAITGSGAARGLLRSGGTGQAISNKTAELAQQSGQNYLGNLMNLAQLGNQSASIIGGAGQVSTGTSSGNSSSNNGIFSSIPLFSDKRLKRDIKLVGVVEVPVGSGTDAKLNLYSYRYVWSPKRHIGVMAQDVAKVKPEALGPRILGFMTVRYDRLFNTEK